MSGIETSTGATANAQPQIFRLDAPEIAGMVNIFPNDPTPTYAKHIMRPPSFGEYEGYLARMPTETILAGKIEGRTAQESSTEDDVASEVLYNAIALRIRASDYEWDESLRLAGEDGQPEEELRSLLSFIEEESAKLDEGEEELELDANLELFDLSAPRDKKGRLIRFRLKDLIPLTHKAGAISALAPGFIERERIEGQKVRLGGGVREWTFIHKIGVRRLDDGSLSEPSFVIKYRFEEPSKDERKRFKNKSVTAKTIDLPGGGRKQISSTNLRPVTDLFRTKIKRIEGAGLGAELREVNCESPNDLDLVPPAFMLAAATKLFLDLDAEAKI